MKSSHFGQQGIKSGTFPDRKNLRDGMRELRIIHVLNSRGYSGAENVVVTIIKKLEDRPGLKFYYISPEGSIGEVLRERGIEYVPLRKLDVKSLKPVIRKIRPDIIHAHDYSAGIVSALCFPKAGIINHLHNNSPWIKKVNAYSLAYFVASLSFKKILTVSASIEDEYVFGKPLHNKILCIGNPVDTKAIAEKSCETMPDQIGCYHRNKLSDYRPDVMFIGRQTPQKNPPLLIGVVRELVERKPDVQVAMLGAGELFDDTRQKLGREIEAGNVRMFGFVENPYPLLAKAKCLILPSKWEGFGLVAVEAFSLGVPVVCSGAGGLKDIVNDRCGLICGEDKAAYVDEILKLITNDEYYRSKSVAALNRAADLDNVTSYMNTICGEYEKVTRSC